jgi:hypothetical protein
MKRLAPLLIPLAALALLSFLLPRAQERKLGHDDTPMLPGGEWRVHDGARPQPPIVTPGVGTAPPSDAIVLFDGTNLDAWKSVKGEEKWELVDGVMEVNGTGSLETCQHFGDLQLHLEWASPTEVKGEDQGRGNSGVFLMGLYEVQILDSFENRTYPDGQAAAIYGVQPPLVNACRGPGEWQSFDIFFEAPIFEEGELVSPARTTVIHNGVLVQHHAEFLGASTYRKLPVYSPHPPTGPLLLQDHWCPIHFRNIWVRPL